MKVHSVLFSAQNSVPKGSADNDAHGAKPVYAVINSNDKVQIDTINRALDELKKVEFHPNDLIYVQTMGANPPYSSGCEAYEWIKNNNVEIVYADFSDSKIHACLDSDKNRGTKILINSNYKNTSTFADVLAISEAIFHECGHGKDKDSENSIQEELDCLSLNVLAHKYYKRKYQGIFDNQNSFLYQEGVSLYPKLFFQFDKAALKARVLDKYGYLQSGDIKHPASALAQGIKDIYNKGVNAS